MKNDPQNSFEETDMIPRSVYEGLIKDYGAFVRRAEMVKKTVSFIFSITMNMLRNSKIETRESLN